jgi:hypothetical protein
MKTFPVDEGLNAISNEEVPTRTEGGSSGTLALGCANWQDNNNSNKKTNFLIS